MYTFTTIGMTKKAMATGLAAAAILAGGVAAEASGVTAVITGRADTHVAAQTGGDRALEALAALEANAHANAGLEKARAAIAADHSVDASADVRTQRNGPTSANSGIGAEVSAEAQTRMGSMKDFVLNLLGIEAGARANASVNSASGTETAINAVTNAKANAAAEHGISTALGAIATGQAGAEAAADARANAEVGLAKAASVANANAEGALDGVASAGGKGGLRLGISLR